MDAPNAAFLLAVIVAIALPVPDIELPKQQPPKPVWIHTHHEQGRSVYAAIMVGNKPTLSGRFDYDEFRFPCYFHVVGHWRHNQNIGVRYDRWKLEIGYGQNGNSYVVTLPALRIVFKELFGTKPPTKWEILKRLYEL